MYRNSEGYPDPTVGAAFDHMAYERRRLRREARLKQAEEIKRKQESEKQQREKLRKAKARAYRKAWEKRQHWTLAWTCDSGRVNTIMKEGA